jgi:5-methylcytosine-specific restriction endonuclease McrA
MQAPQYGARLYGRRWRDARLQFLQQNPLCAMCSTGQRPVAAGVVDHIRPHKGDRTLFWDRSNWQSLCKPCHDGAKQSEERTGRTRGCDADGNPLDPKHASWTR